VAYVQPLAAPHEVSDLQSAVRERHPDANHVAVAWRHSGKAGFDDDGEPTGTAGRPMLTVLERRDLDRVVCACVRWFGGVKLGAGGLIRAYGGTTAKALDAAGVREVHATAWVEVDMPFAMVDAVLRRLKARERTVVGDVSYTTHGATVGIEVRETDVDTAARDVQAWSNGRAELRLA